MIKFKLIDIFTAVSLFAAIYFWYFIFALF
jgi:hypothetical protein